MTDLERGKFIVIEGTDGSGKGTQIEPLAKYLESQGYNTKVVSFPRYKENMYGVFVSRYLDGKYGRDVHPDYAVLPYAIDRLLAKPMIEQWLDGGVFVIANRYQPSNTAFQSARLPVDERENFIRWIEDLEYKENKIPRENLVLLMNVTPDVSYSMIERKGIRDYLNREGRDILEDNLGYQRTVAEMYLWLAANRSHWRIIDCMRDSKIRQVEEITGLMVEVLIKEGLVKNG